MSFLNISNYTDFMGHPTILLYGLLLSFIIGMLPFGKFPLIWQFFKAIGAFFYQKLNRAQRSKTEKKIRGFVALIFILTSVIFCMRFIFNLPVFDGYHVILEIMIIGLSVSTLQSWTTYIKGLKMLKTKSTQRAMFFYDLTQDDSKLSDIHKCHRDLVIYLTRSIERFLIAPCFFYLIFGLYGLVIYSSLSALYFTSSYQHSQAKDYAFTITMTYTILNFIPMILSTILIGILSLLINPKSLQKLFALLRVAKTNHLKIIAVMANVTNLTLMGPALQDGISSNQPWIGHDDATAKPSAIHLRKALLCYSAVLLIVTAIMTIMAFGFHDII